MKISFVIPSFNAVTWLPHAVSSCLQQTYKYVEVIIIDDGSTDRTVDLLKWYHANEPRVKSVTGPNQGRSRARNLGNNTATGDIICVLDADDLATPNRAELTVKKFKNGEPDYIYGSATIMDVLGRPLSLLTADVVDRARCLDAEKNPHLQNRIVHSTAAYTKAFAEKFPYREGEVARLGLDDWAQQIEALAAGAKFDFIPHRLGCYRQLESQITKTRDEQAVLEAKKAFLAGLQVPA